MGSEKVEENSNGRAQEGQRKGSERTVEGSEQVNGRAVECQRTSLHSGKHTDRPPDSAPRPTYEEQTHELR